MNNFEKFILMLDYLEISKLKIFNFYEQFSSVENIFEIFCSDENISKKVF